MALLRDDPASHDVRAAHDAGRAGFLAEQAAFAEEGSELAGRVRPGLLPLPGARDGDARDELRRDAHATLDHLVRVRVGVGVGVGS